jgi:hypothetical protein
MRARGQQRRTVVGANWRAPKAARRFRRQHAGAANGPLCPCSLLRVRRESVQSDGPRLRRFRVGFVAYSQRPVVYTVSTWFDELMAVALASNAHADRHPRSPINHVFVEEVESLASSDLDALPEGEVLNLNEWR